MNATSVDLEPTVGVSHESRQQLSELARHLDRFARSAEEFLCQQFEQLERGIDEFEREKAAWRRQLRRESSQLVRQREELERLRSESSSDGAESDAAAARAQKNRTIAGAARASGAGSVRILLRPGKASSMQVGLLMFELSKLNRDMGGQGLRFEVVQVRKPRRRLFGRRSKAASAGKILEIAGFSVQPLAARGSHVLLDVDDTDRVENWIAFKARLLRSCLNSNDLGAEFLDSKPVRDGESCSIIQEAAAHADQADVPANAYSSASMFANTSIGAVQQQLERLECCYESIRNETGLHVHVELATSASSRLKGA